jgi:hypothetical protein
MTTTIGGLVGQMLDSNYARAAQATLNAIEQTSVSPLITQRLGELNAEARRLASEDKKLTPDNPVLRALVADMEPALQRSARLLDASADGLQESSAALAGKATRQLANPGVGAQWNVPDPDAIAALVGYADRPAWNDEIANYPGLTLNVMMNQAIRGMVEGWGPMRVARQIAAMATTLPLARATMLTRTLYMESYRTASAASELANADILETSIRIGTLDGRICLCCLALHGTELRVGEKVFDHHGGRCTKISVVKGRPRNIQTGEDWFNAKGATPEGRKEQEAIAGKGNYEALKSGKATLRDFVQSYTDPVFGEMVRQTSLKNVGAR